MVNIIIPNIEPINININIPNNSVLLHVEGDDILNHRTHDRFEWVDRSLADMIVAYWNKNKNITYRLNSDEAYFNSWLKITKVSINPSNITIHSFQQTMAINVILLLKNCVYINEMNRIWKSINQNNNILETIHNRFSDLICHDLCEVNEMENLNAETLTRSDLGIYYNTFLNLYTLNYIPDFIKDYLSDDMINTMKKYLNPTIITPKKYVDKFTYESIYLLSKNQVCINDKRNDILEYIK